MMQQRNILSVLLAAAVATSCTSDQLSLQETTGQQTPVGDVPVNFNAYMARGTTRSGTIDDLTLATLKAGEGFGVFAYHTNSDDYTSDFRPNFMFNQQVKWDDANQVFDYSPVRYWPNEYGERAQSEDVDKVSFFAYAPYVEVNPSTGYLKDPGEYNIGTTWGITGTSRNTLTGDPVVKYITSFELDKTVDLCWGVYNEGESGWSVLTMNGKQTTTNGLPWLNVQHAANVDQRLKFTFRHATAKLRVQVDADVDGDGGAGTTDLGTHFGVGTTDDKTKVYVRSISFTGIAPQGALNLNNVAANTPLWMNYTGTGWIENGQSVTIHDGLRDGYEGTENAEANSEVMTGLNPIIISNTNNTSLGVTKTPVNLFGRPEGTTDIDEGLFVIPTGERVRMTIVYDVETEVPDLPGFLSDGKTHGTSIENRITTDLKYNTKFLTFQGGKQYTLRLHLGMNSVKFDAAVNEDWDEGATIDVPRRYGVTLGNMTPDDINENRGTEANPRAWVICTEGHVHLCQNGCEVEPMSSPDDPRYLVQNATDPAVIEESNTPDVANPLSCHNKKVAIVCYVGPSGSVDKSTTTPGSTNYHGLAIAIEDATKGQWDDDDGVACFTDNQVLSPGNAILTDSHLNGIDHTNQMNDPTGYCTGHGHYAAQYTCGYSAASASSTSYSHATPTDGVNYLSSQWFMPTIAQWALIVKGLTGSDTGLVYGNSSAHGNDKYKTANINNYVEKAAGGQAVADYSYWASDEYRNSETSEYHAWSISFSEGYASPANKMYTDLRVRPVIAF